MTDQLIEDGIDDDDLHLAAAAQHLWLLRPVAL